MNKHTIIALMLAIGCLIFALTKDPEVKTVTVETVRTIVAPSPLAVAPVKAVDEKLNTQVKINNQTMKRMVMGTWSTKDGLSQNIQEFLKMSPEEAEKATEIIKGTITKIKDLELQNLSVRKSQEGDETLVVGSYWESSGKALYESMRDQFAEVLGPGRANILAMGVGTCPTDVGSFGYYQTHVYIKDMALKQGLESMPMVYVDHEAPYSGMRALIEQEADPVKKQKMSDEYEIMEHRFETTNDADAPIARYGMAVPTTHEIVTQRYMHLFKTQEGK